MCFRVNCHQIVTGAGQVLLRRRSIMEVREEFATGLNRRTFLHSAVSGVAIGIAAQAGIELGVPTTLEAQTNLTPDAALKELRAGNERFAANQLTSVEHDLEVLKEHTADKQEPFAAVLACAELRVAVELIFGQTIGHVFVARVAGNMVTAGIIATLEYGEAGVGGGSDARVGDPRCG